MGIKYSEAIRLGGMATTKCRGFFFTESGSVCVQGAALRAIGRLDTDRTVQGAVYNHLNVAKYFPKVRNTLIPRDEVMVVAAEAGIDLDCSLTGVQASNIYPYHDDQYTILQTSIVLNNESKWTRERIADWVQRMEDKYGIHDDQSESESLSLEYDEERRSYVYT